MTSRKKKASAHGEREHAPLPPSASSRWLKCPPSPEYVRRLIATKNIAKRVSGSSAQRGTRIHELSEPALAVAVETGSRPVVRHEDGHDKDEIREAKAYVDYCWKAWTDALALDKKARCWIEKRSTVTEICWGSNDFAILACKRLTVIDLKSGRETVDPRTTQLMIYAKGILREIRQPVNEVESVIWQPNADDGGPPDRSHVYPIEEFNELFTKVETGIQRASAYWENGEVSFQELQRNLVAGDHCTWCDAYGACPAAARKNMEISQTAFAPVLTGSPEMIAPPDPRELDAGQIARVLDRAKMFGEWLDAVRVHAIEMIQRGTKVPGWKAVAKQTHRNWTDSLAPSVVAKAMGVPVEKVLCPPRLVSPSQLEDAFGARARKWTPGHTGRPFAVTIAKVSDRRVALDSTKISFQPVTRGDDE